MGLSLSSPLCWGCTGHRLNPHQSLDGFGGGISAERGSHRTGRKGKPGLGDVGCSDANHRCPSAAAFNLKGKTRERERAEREACCGRKKSQPQLIQPCFVLGFPSWGSSVGPGCFHPRLRGEEAALPAALLPPHLPLVGPLVSEGRPVLPEEPHLTPVCFSLSPQPTHELRLPALQFQDAEHRVPEPASQHIHRGFRHSHLRLHPQFALLLLLDQVRKHSPAAVKSHHSSDRVRHRSLRHQKRMVSPRLSTMRLVPDRCDPHSGLIFPHCQRICSRETSQCSSRHEKSWQRDGLWFLLPA